NWTCHSETQGKIFENISLPLGWVLYGRREKLVSCERNIFINEHDTKENQAVFLVNVILAYEVYWNGTLIDQKGSLMEDKEEFDPTPNLVLIAKEKIQFGENTLKILTYDPSGFGGIFRIPIFGKADDMEKEAFAYMVKVGGLIFLCFFLFLFYILYYFQNPFQKEMLYFSFTCFFIGINMSCYYKVSYYINSSFVFNYLSYNLSLGLFSLGLVLFFYEVFEQKLSFISWLLFAICSLYLLITLFGGLSNVVRDFHRSYLIALFIVFVPVLLSLELARYVLKGKNLESFGVDYIILASLVAILALNHSYLRFFIQELPKEELTVESFLTFVIGMILTISQKQKYVQERLNLIEKNYQEDLKKEIKEKTSELETANEKLQEDHAFKNKLFSIIAHDLRSPLNSLELLLDLLKENDIESEEFQEFSNEISLSLHNNQFLLSTLLYWVSQQVKKREVILEEFAPSDIFEETIQILSPNILQKKIQIQRKYGKDCLVYSDRNMIRIILRNLLNNAIKFSESNSKLILGYRIYETECEFFVQDFGVGMSEQVQKEILDSKVTQIESQRGTENEKGLGLGLKLSFAFLKELGSEIFLSSQKGKGSKFWFRIPLSNKTHDTHS
ncbi:MAG: HAMP domain-containing histidine kinase, partial [Leptospiraceae bacterium]|nr:HAMP domain-containing histidine kinase [Leptospiraceae bacterium]